jgi:hypothetical protein
VSTQREREREKRGYGGCNPLSQVQFICWTIQWLKLLASAGVRYIENYSMSMEHSILWIQIYGPNTRLHWILWSKTRLYLSGHSVCFFMGWRLEAVNCCFHTNDWVVDMINYDPFLGAFTKLRKATISFVLFVHMEHLGSHRIDFHDIWHFSINKKSVQKIQVSLKLDTNECNFTWRPLYIFYHISLSFSCSENRFRQNCSYNTHFMFSKFFFENGA